MKRAWLLLGMIWTLAACEAPVETGVGRIARAVGEWEMGEDESPGTTTGGSIAACFASPNASGGCDVTDSCINGLVATTQYHAAEGPVPASCTCTCEPAFEELEEIEELQELLP